MPLKIIGHFKQGLAIISLRSQKLNILVIAVWQGFCLFCFVAKYSIVHYNMKVFIKNIWASTVWWYCHKIWFTYAVVRLLCSLNFWVPVAEGNNEVQRWKLGRDYCKSRTLGVKLGRDLCKSCTLGMNLGRDYCKSCTLVWTWEESIANPILWVRTWEETIANPAYWVGTWVRAGKRLLQILQTVCTGHCEPGWCYLK